MATLESHWNQASARACVTGMDWNCQWLHWNRTGIRLRPELVSLEWTGIAGGYTGIALELPSLHWNRTGIRLRPELVSLEWTGIACGYTGITLESGYGQTLCHWNGAGIAVVALESDWNHDGRTGMPLEFSSYTGMMEWNGIPAGMESKFQSEKWPQIPFHSSHVTGMAIPFQSCDWNGNSIPVM